MIYWKGEKFWVGKLLERPDIMTQGETLEELEEKMKEAFLMMTSVDGSSVGKNLTLKKIRLFRS
jgi:predicted RNase H-like HicB family nuclease